MFGEMAQIIISMGWLYSYEERTSLRSTLITLVSQEKLKNNILKTCSRTGL